MNANRVKQPFRMSTRLPIEAEKLRQPGDIFQVRIRYDGRFGERDIFDVSYLDEEGLPLLPNVTESVSQEIKVFLQELLELRFPGWETAEGARGEFQWHVHSDELRHRHEVRVTEYREVEINTP